MAVTPPARRRSRRGRPTPTPVGEEAGRLGIPCLEAADVNVPEVLTDLAAAAPRRGGGGAFGRVLRPHLLSLAALGAVNLHFSLLPRWRGAAPVQRAILAGDAETGVCVQRVVARLDAGDVFDVRRVQILPRDDTASLRTRLTDVGAPLLEDVVRRLVAGVDVPATQQDEALVTRARRIERDEGILDFAEEDARELDRRVRALHEWPGCPVRVERTSGEAALAQVHEGVPEEARPDAGVHAAAGTVLESTPGGIVVAAREGALRILALQRPGGRVLDARAFLNGLRISAGDRFVRAPRE